MAVMVDASRIPLGQGSIRLDPSVDLIIAQSRIASLGRHDAAAPLHAINGISVESSRTFINALSPCAFVADTRCSGYASAMTGYAHPVIDFLSINSCTNHDTMFLSDL